MKYILLSVLLAGICACSSKPLDVNYYVLSPPRAVEQLGDTNKTQQVTVNKIVIADYLKQSSIAMQIGENKMYFSRQDVWAESLQGAISNAMLGDLNQSPNTQYHNDQRPDSNVTGTTLTLHIEHFHATDKSTVIASGRYWLVNQGNELKIAKPFFFSLALEQDGYSHAITKQRQLLRLLAQDIHHEVDRLYETIK